MNDRSLALKNVKQEQDIEVIVGDQLADLLRCNLSVNLWIGLCETS